MSETEIQEAANKYSNATTTMIDKDELQEAKCYSDIRNEQNAFLYGIEWYEENLWHDATEEPKKAGCQILAEQDFYGKRQFQVYIFNGSAFYRDKVHNCNIVRWLYIDDLLEGGEG